MIAWRCLLRPIGIPNYRYNQRCHEKTRATVNQIQSTGHCSKNVDLVNSGEVFLGSDIYIYIHMLTPLETYRFRFVCVLQRFLFGFAFKSSQHFFHSFEDFWMLEHDESRCFMCRFNDIFWGYLQRFRLPYCVPKKVKYWQNAHSTVAKCQFWALHWFFTMFLFLLVTHVFF